MGVGLGGCLAVSYNIVDKSALHIYINCVAGHDRVIFVATASVG